jgi:hypothetical protein
MDFSAGGPLQLIKVPNPPPMANPKNTPLTPVTFICPPAYQFDLLAYALVSR